MDDVFTDMSRQNLRYHFEHETLHSAVSLSKLDSDFFEAVKPNIAGLMDIVHGKTEQDKVLRASNFRARNPFEFLFKSGSFIYIAPYYVIEGLR